MQCPISLVTNYTLEVVLEDSGQNMTEQSTTISSTSPAVSLEVEDLMEKEAYTYSIVAINAIGRATTSSTSFRKFYGENKLISLPFHEVEHLLFYIL